MPVIDVDRWARPALSIVVPVTRPASALSRCLEAIEAARGAQDEVIVVNRRGVGGPASARNHGAEQASNPVLVFVDADVEVGREALTLIRSRFATDPALIAVFGSYDDTPDAEDVVSTFRNLLHHYVHQGAAGSVGSFWTGLGAVRRDAFDEVGGFDVAHAWIEDVEFGARLRTAGQIQLDPAIQCKHLKRWTLVSMVHTDVAHRGIPWTRLAMRGRAPRGELNLSWRHRISAASSLLLVLSLTRRRTRSAAASLGILCALNQRFYRLLARRGKRYFVSGLGLHVIHHLTGILSLVLGVLDPSVFARRASRRSIGDSVVSADQANDRDRAGGQATAGPESVRLENGVDVTDDEAGTPDEWVAA